MNAQSSPNNEMTAERATTTTPGRE